MPKSASQNRILLRSSLVFPHASFCEVRAEGPSPPAVSSGCYSFPRSSTDARVQSGQVWRALGAHSSRETGWPDTFYPAVTFRPVYRHEKRCQAGADHPDAHATTAARFSAKRAFRAPPPTTDMAARASQPSPKSTAVRVLAGDVGPNRQDQRLIDQRLMIAVIRLGWTEGVPRRRCFSSAWMLSYLVVPPVTATGWLPSNS